MFASKQGILQRILGRTGVTTKLENLSADVADLGNIGSDNFLINGAMEFNQRYGSTAVIAGTGGIGGDKYIFDRWWSNGSADVYHEVQRISVTDLVGFQYAWSSKRINAASGNIGFINQPLEYENIIPLQGKRVTVSYYMKIPIVPTNGLRDIVNYSGTANQKEPATNIYDSGLYSGSGMTSWTRRSFSFTVPTSAKSLLVRLAACGSNIVLNAEIQITGVMLNIGSQPAPFVRAGKTIGGELALCQRYYEKSSDIDTDISAHNIYSTAYTGASSRIFVKYNVTKRGSPIITTKSDAATTTGTSSLAYSVTGVNNYTDGSIVYQNQSGFNLITPSANSGAPTRLGWISDAEL